MAYIKQNFKNGTVLKADALNKIEAGIVANEQAIAKIQLKEGPAGPKGDPGQPGAKGDTGANGKDGAKGEAGKTPVKGVDYYTAEEKQALVDEIAARDIVLKSSTPESVKTFKITVDDQGTLKAEEILPA